MGKLPLYAQILNQLKEQIYTKKYQIGDKLPTEQELSEQYQVSRITAKRVLNELEREGFVERKQGSGSFLIHDGSNTSLTLFSKSTNQNILFLTQLSNEENFNLLTKGITEQMERSPYSLFVQPIHTFQEYDPHTIQENFAGVITFPTQDISLLATFYKLYLKNFPIIFLRHHQKYLPYPSICTDHISGSCQATEYLLTQGHKNILFLANIPHNTGRFLGYIKALAKENINNHYFYEWPINEEIEPDEQLIKDCLALINKKQITAIVSENDLIAITFIQAMRKYGISIPKDISIVGFENRFAGQLLSPTLTTVAPPLEAIGKKAVKALIQQIETGTLLEKDIIVPPSLIIRESVSSPKQGAH